jgi:hypothetical protein
MCQRPVRVRTDNDLLVALGHELPVGSLGKVNVDRLLIGVSTVHKDTLPWLIMDASDPSVWAYVARALVLPDA